jgi:hypothetical protein
MARQRHGGRTGVIRWQVHCTQEAAGPMRETRGRSHLPPGRWAQGHSVTVDRHGYRRRESRRVDWVESRTERGSRCLQGAKKRWSLGHYSPSSESCKCSKKNRPGQLAPLPVVSSLFPAFVLRVRERTWEIWCTPRLADLVHAARLPFSSCSVDLTARAGTSSTDQARRDGVPF